MYCNKCGKELHEGDLFCSGCGTRVEPTDRKPFRMDEINWDLDGYPKDTPRRSRDTMFDWSSAMEEPEPDRSVTEADIMADVSRVDLSDEDWKAGATVRVGTGRPDFRNTLASDDPDFKVGSSIFSSSRGFDDEAEVQLNSADFVPPLNRGGNIFYTGSDLKKKDIEEKAAMPTHPEQIIPDDDASAFLADSVDISDAIQPLNPEVEEEGSFDSFEKEYLNPDGYTEEYRGREVERVREYDDDDDEKDGSLASRLFAGVSNVFSKLDILSEDDEDIEDVDDIIDSDDEPGYREHVVEPEPYDYEDVEREGRREPRIKSPIRFKSPKSTTVDRKTAVEDFERDIREASEAGSAISVEKPRSSSDKFYTFNQKSDEFRALLDEEYERLRQKIVEESGGTESALERAYKKGEEARAKRAAERAAQEAEEARIKAEEEARAKAEEEARIKAEEEAKAKAEEEARIKAEEEAKAKAEEEARIKAEEEAKAKAEEEAKAKAEEEARIKAEGEAKAVEAKAEEEAAQAVEEVAQAEEEAAPVEAEEPVVIEELNPPQEEEVKLEVEDIVEIPEEEADPNDFERRLAELTSQMESLPGFSSDAPIAVGSAAAVATETAAVSDDIDSASKDAVGTEQEDSEIEIKTIDPNEDEAAFVSRNTVVIDRNEAKEALKEEDRRLRYGDIFNNEEEEEEEVEESGGRAKLIILDILIAILLVCVILTAIMVFGENTAIGQKLHSLIGLSSPAQEQEAEERVVGEAAEATTGEETTESEISPTAAAIVQQATKNVNIGEIAEDTALLFDGDTDYGLEGVQFASIFTDSDWYTDGDGNNVTYMTELVGTMIDYHSKLVDRYDHGSEDVLALVDPESNLYSELEAIEPEDGVVHSITKLQIGEVRQDGANFYMLIRVAESISNQDAPIVTVKLAHMSTATGEVIIKDIVPIQ